MDFTSLKDLDLKGKRVLLRVDLNVPKQDGRITDTTRIDRLKPTIDALRSAGARIIILSHFGRPKGEKESALSLAFILKALETAWGAPVRFTQNCIGETAQTLCNSLQDGDIVLLENLRFHAGEEKNDPEFAKELAKLGDIYVNDAFSAAHRAHASTEGLAHLLPSAAGLLMEEELRALDQALENPKRPVAAIAGGSKISTKLSVLKNLVQKVDILILGGGMANTFLFAQGADIGGSLCEKDMADQAREIMALAEDKGCKILLPSRVVVVSEIQTNAANDIVDSTRIPEGKMAIDAAPDAVDDIADKIKGCHTIVWNGPLGVFEVKPFDAGTNILARAVAQMTKSGQCVSVAGGGDTVSALENAGVAEDFSYISTAGGAFLEWLEGKTLPGVAALSVNKKAA